MASNQIPFSTVQVQQLFYLEHARLTASTVFAKAESNARVVVMQEEFKAKIAILQEESKARMAVLEQEHKAKTEGMQEAARVKEKRLNEESVHKQSWERVLGEAKLSNISYEQDVRVAREGVESEER
jgi:hypothetical protein